MTKTEPKHYYRTEFKIVVLSEEYDEENPVPNWNLSDILCAITDGDCSGEFECVSSVELTPKAMADALILQGSDPEFFGLDENGNPVDEDEEQNG